MKRSTIPVLIALLALTLWGCGDEGLCRSGRVSGRSRSSRRPKETFRRRLCPLVIHAGFTVLPNGDALVAESNAPANSNATRYSRHCYGLGHAAGGWDVPSPNRITLLRDLDGNGIAETKSMFLKGLNSPLGMALVGDSLYVADTDALLRFPYRDGDTKIATPPENGRLAGGPDQLPLAEERNREPDGSKLWWAPTAMPARMG
jgi:glucose/arabinose dehydrogenase